MANTIPRQLGCESLGDALETAARLWPDHVAVVDGEQQVTYAELLERARILAAHLQELGAMPERYVALALRRGIHQVVAIVATILSGAAYVPLDISWPRERIDDVVTRTNPVALIVDETPSWMNDLCITLLSVTSPACGTPRKAVLRADSPAYVIFTSGSTGKPKGVVVTHRNVLRLLQEADRFYRFSSDDVWSMFHHYTFDVSVFEMFGALLFGGRIVVVPELVARSADEFVELLVTQGVTILSQTPSAFKALLLAIDYMDTPAQDFALRYVIFAGEALDPASFRPWFTRFCERATRLVNMYGITEVAVHLTIREITSKDLATTDSPIGLPLADSSIVLLDQELQQIENGAIGEIFVGGPAVARGYLGQPSLTAERFIPNPMSAVPGERLYRSGDLASFSGQEFLYRGRCDDQVKIRGYRIELGEIESHIANCPDVTNGAVVHVKDSYDGRLLAFVIAADESANTAERVLSFLQARLPSYMIPSRVYIIPEMPLTSNGKVDRAALRRFDEVRN